MKNDIVNGPAEEGDAGERKNPLGETLVQMQKIKDLEQELAQRRDLEQKMDALNAEVARQRDVLSLRDTEITKLHREAANKLLTGKKAGSNPSSVPFNNTPEKKLELATEQRESFMDLYRQAWHLTTVRTMSEQATDGAAELWKGTPGIAAVGASTGMVLGALVAVPAVGPVTLVGVAAGAAVGCATGGLIGIAIPIGAIVVKFIVAKAAAHITAAAIAAYAKAHPLIEYCATTLSRWIKGALAWLKSWFVSDPEVVVAAASA